MREGDAREGRREARGEEEEEEDKHVMGRRVMGRWVGVAPVFMKS